MLRAIAAPLLRSTIRSPLLLPSRHLSSLGFTPTLPPTLSSIIKPEMFVNLSSPETSSLWQKYHHDKDQSVGASLPSPPHSTASLHANGASSPFYIHPIFSSTDAPNFFVLLVQFFPEHEIFVLTDLERYKQDPSSANPLMMFKAYDDYEDSKNLILVRGDIVNAGLLKPDALQTITSVITSYTDGYDAPLGPSVFNHESSTFNVDLYIESCRKQVAATVEGQEF